MTDIPVKVWEEKIVYQWKIIEVVEQRMKIWTAEKTFEFARRSPGTRLIIVNEKGEMLITKEWRSELENFDYRLPGGKVFDTLGEYNHALANNHELLAKAKQWAILEAREECGIQVLNLELFTISKCGATMVWDLYYFLVKEFKMLENQKLWHWEHIEVNRMDLDQVKKLCLSNQFSEERSAAVIMKYLNNL